MILRGRAILLPFISILAGLLLVGRYMPWWIQLFLIGMLGMRIWIEWKQKPVPSAWVSWILAVSSIAFLLLFNAEELSYRDRAVFVLVLLAACKLLETKTERDWRIVIVIGFFVNVATLFYSQSLFAALLLLILTLLLTASLAQLQRYSVHSSLKQAFIVTLLAMPLTLGQFYLIPRMSAPLWQGEGLGFGSSQGKTGIGNELELGKVAQLVLDYTPAFAVIFNSSAETPDQNEMYWRVQVLGEFDGRVWRDTHPKRQALSRSADAVKKMQERGLIGFGNTRLVTYRMSIVPEDRRIPALDYPNKAPRGLGMIGMRLFRLAGEEHSEQRFTAESYLNAGILETLTPDQLAYYTYLPKGISPKTQELAQQLKQQNPQTLDFATAAFNYFKEQDFLYVLAPEPLVGDQIDSFMFTTKEGYCEYYAAAFTVMARAAQIPARMVTGYQGAEYNNVGGFWQVYSSNAHAWVEIWDADSGAWRRVDPTAAVSAARIDGGINSYLQQTRTQQETVSGWKMAWIKYTQAVNYFWGNWVVNYDQMNQRSLLRHLGLGSYYESGTWIKLFLILGAIVLLPVGIWWIYQARLARDDLQDGWKLLRHKLQKAAISLDSALGPLEIQQRVQKALPMKAQEETLLLIQRYIQLQYGCLYDADYIQAQAKIWHQEIRRFSLKLLE